MDEKAKVRSWLWTLLARLEIQNIKEARMSENQTNVVIEIDFKGE